MNKGLEKLKHLYNSKQALNNIRFNYFESKRNEDANVEHFWFDAIEKELKALEIIKKHLSITNAVEFNDKKEVKRTIELFDIDLWNDGKQKEDFEFVKEVML